MGVGLLGDPELFLRSLATPGRVPGVGAGEGGKTWQTVRPFLLFYQAAITTERGADVT